MKFLKQQRKNGIECSVVNCLKKKLLCSVLFLYVKANGKQFRNQVEQEFSYHLIFFRRYGKRKHIEAFIN